MWGGSRSTCPHVTRAGFGSSQVMGLEGLCANVTCQPEIPVSCPMGLTTEHLRTGKWCPSARQHGPHRRQFLSPDLRSAMSLWLYSVH